MKTNFLGLHSHFFFPFIPLPSLLSPFVVERILLPLLFSLVKILVPQFDYALLLQNVNMKVANAAFKTKVSKKTSSEERTNERMGAGSFARSESLSSREARLRTIAP
jgi:hypothetical protein